MKTEEIVQSLEALAAEAKTLENDPKGIAGTRVKAWKTQVDQVLQAAGTSARQTRTKFQELRFERGADPVKQQAYQAAMEAAGRLLASCAQTIKFFGRPEDKKLPDFGKPRAARRAVGSLKVGDRELDVKTIHIRDILRCLQTFVAETRHLNDQARERVSQHLDPLADDPLLEPLWKTSLDEMFSYWED